MWDCTVGGIDRRETDAIHRLGGTPQVLASIPESLLCGTQGLQSSGELQQDPNVQ